MKRGFAVFSLVFVGFVGFAGCATSADSGPGTEETDAATGSDGSKSEAGFQGGDGSSSDGSSRDGTANGDGGTLADGAIEDARGDGGFADGAPDSGAEKDAGSDAGEDAGLDSGADAASDAGASANPTVTDVVIASTTPNNGAIAYNTGAATATITGTHFTGVTCPTGVKLDDRNGEDVAVGTHPTSCTVDSDTQITAIFPAGIRTNGSTGWNVIVTNASGSNAASSVAFVPRAGLLISEILIATSTDNNDEFVEIYNPTGNAIDTTSSGIDLKLHQRASGAGATDTSKILTLVGSRTGSIPSHGFLLLVSNVAITNGETWTSHADYSYAAAFGANGGAYISLSGTDQAKVIDKVGWGSQASGGYETTAISPTIATGDSVQRKPAGASGAATDTDVNSDDFNAQSASITPEGSADPVVP